MASIIWLKFLQPLIYTCYNRSINFFIRNHNEVTHHDTAIARTFCLRLLLSTAGLPGERPEYLTIVRWHYSAEALHPARPQHFREATERV